MSPARPLYCVVLVCLTLAVSLVESRTAKAALQIAPQNPSHLDRTVHSREYPPPLEPDELRRMSRQLNIQRQKDLTRDTAKLLELTQAFKSEADSGNEAFSAAVTLRKIEQIEKLAHKIREEMVITPGPQVPITIN